MKPGFLIGRIPRVIPGQRAVFEISIAPGRGLRVERFFLIHSGAPEQCALEAELLSSLTQVRGEISSPLAPTAEMQIPAEQAQAEGDSALRAA